MNHSVLVIARPLTIIVLCLYMASPLRSDNKWVFLSEEWKPFNYKSDSKEVDGFTTEIVERIASHLGLDISITINPWSRSYKMALSNVNHAIFSIYRTPKREALFKWVGPIYRVDTLLWGLKERKLAISNLDDAKKYRIIVQKDSAYQQVIEEKGFKNVTLNSIQSEARMVLKGRGDLVPLSAFSHDKLIKANVEAGMVGTQWKAYAILYSKSIYIAFNKNTQEQTVAAWQAELVRIKNLPIYEQLKDKFINSMLK